jgi:hypothetical protein
MPVLEGVNDEEYTRWTSSIHEDNDTHAKFWWRNCFTNLGMTAEGYEKPEVQQ